MAGSVDRALVILLSGNTDDKIRFSELLSVLIRKWHRDGVNLPIQVEPSVLARPVRAVQS